MSALRASSARYAPFPSAPSTLNVISLSSFGHFETENGKEIKRLLVKWIFNVFRFQKLKFVLTFDRNKVKVVLELRLAESFVCSI